MKRKLQGQYVTISTVGEKAEAFVPAPLPPNPSIEWTPDLRGKFDRALLALGRLDIRRQESNERIIRRLFRIWVERGHGPLYGRAGVDDEIRVAVTYQAFFLAAGKSRGQA